MIREFRRSSVSKAATLVLLGVLSASAIAHPGAGIAVDRAGQIYFLDTGSGLWKIDVRGRLSHLSTTRFHWLAIDEQNRFAATQLPSGSDSEIVKVGSSPTVLLSSDYPITVGEDGNLYYPLRASGNLKLMKMTPAGESSAVITLPAMVSGRPVPHLGGIIAGPAGSVFYSEDGAIRKVDAHGRVTTLAAVQALANGPSIPGIAEHPYLRGFAMDRHGVIYVADAGDARVLKISSGKITTILQTQSPWSPTAVASFNNDVYVLEFLHTASDVRTEWLPRVRKIGANGRSIMVATIDKMPGAR